MEESCWLQQVSSCANRLLEACTTNPKPVGETQQRTIMPAVHQALGPTLHVLLQHVNTEY